MFPEPGGSSEYPTHFPLTIKDIYGQKATAAVYSCGFLLWLDSACTSTRYGQYSNGGPVECQHQQHGKITEVYQSLEDLALFKTGQSQATAQEKHAPV